MHISPNKNMRSIDVLVLLTYSTLPLDMEADISALLQNSLKFECTQELSDSEGRYVIVKGFLENQKGTSCYGCAPPNSNIIVVKILLKTFLIR